MKSGVTKLNVKNTNTSRTVVGVSIRFKFKRCQLNTAQTKIMNNSEIIKLLSQANLVCISLSIFVKTLARALSKINEALDVPGTYCVRCS